MDEAKEAAMSVETNGAKPAQYVKVQGVAERKSLLGLLTAEEIAEDVHLSPARLLELADAFIVPHVRVDGGRPLFKRSDIVAYVKNALMQFHPGKPLPLNMSPVVVDRPAVEDMPLPLAALHKQLCEFMPALPCVYFLVKDGDIIYVGQTINLQNRLSQHYASGKRWDRVLYIFVPQEKLLAVEARWIKALDPPLNRSCRDKDEME